MGKWSKKAAVSILVIMMVIGILPGLFITGEGRANAATDYIGAGAGTSSDPYLIATADQLNDVRNHLGASFKLTADIDLTDYSTGEGWVPLGYNVARFSGNMNGNGYKITNLQTNRPDVDSGDYMGLFYSIDVGSNITNMALENVVISGYYTAGSLAAVNRGTISNSYATGSVSVTDQWVGGLVGANMGTISYSYTTVEVSGNGGVGGLVGENKGIISNSYAIGEVNGGNGSCKCTGGLVAWNLGETASIINSYATGNVNGVSVTGGLVGLNTAKISDSYATGKASGNLGIGGLVGQNANSGTISKSYAVGEVIGNNSIGGLVGTNSNGGAVSDSYAKGNVSGGINTGGLIGNNYSNGTVSNSYAMGSISMTVGFEFFAGGLVGAYDASGTISHSFYDKDTTGQSDLTKGEGKPTIEMISEATYTGSDWRWDLQSVWGIHSLINNGYPYVRASLIYDGNGNTEGDVPVDGNTYSLGVTASVNGNTGYLAKTGYTFAGWNVLADGNGMSYMGTDSLKLAGVTTLYAKWTANTYTVTFDAEDGAVSPGTQTKQFGATYGVGADGTTEAVLPVPTRTDYTFGGWYDGDNGTGNAVTDATTVTSAANHTLYAKWTANTYTVTFDAEGGVAVSQTPMKRYGSTYGKGADGTTDAPLPTTTRAGYTFGGWYTATGGTGTQVTDATNVTATTDHTLYAKWTNIPPTVTSVSVSPATASVVQGATQQLAATVTVVDGAAQTVTWTSSDPKVTVSASGLVAVAVDAATGDYTLTATSTFDASKTGTATITVTAAPVAITTAAIAGVPAPVTGATPVATVTETTYYTGTVIWSSSPVIFAAGTAYTATITIMPKAGYTLTDVAQNFFTIAGATTTNAANTGVVIAVFPTTAPVTPSGGGGGGALTIDTPITSTDGRLTLPAGRAGEVSLGDAVTISIPIGATDKELKLTIDKMLDAQKLLTNKEVLASPIYEILKNFSDNFSKPVTLTFTFDLAKVKSNQRAAVFYYDEVKKVWLEVPGGKISGNTIAVEVDHFTKYAVLVVDQATGMPVVDQPTDTVKEIHLSDIAGHWAEVAIWQAVSSDIVEGYTDGTFKPNHTVTRAEFAVMLMNALKPQGDGSKLTFTDNVKIGAWAQKAIAQAVQAGILIGFNDGTFRPNAEITRTEMAVMLAKALGQYVEANTATGFADDKDIPVWAKGSVAFVKQVGIIEGKGGNEFAPQDHATRAEAVTVLLKMLAQMNK